MKTIAEIILFAAALLLVANVLPAPGKPATECKK